MNECLICKRLNNYPLCKRCAKDPFLVEKSRQILADMNDLVTLKKTYTSNYAEIKNLNSRSFWNKRLSDKTNLKKQDGMTQDRVKVAYKFFPENAKKILDIGAGYGFIEELLNRNKNIKIFANDISSVAIKSLKYKFSCQFRKESIYNMRYSKNFFDTVFILEVLEHIPPFRIFEVLKKIKNILKKDGRLIISVPTNEGLEKMKNNPSGHVRTYSENLIKAEMEMAGFEVTKIERLYAFSSLYRFKKMLSIFIKNRWKPNNIVILARSL